MEIMSRDPLFGLGGASFLCIHFELIDITWESSLCWAAPLAGI